MSHREVYASGSGLCSHLVIAASLVIVVAPPVLGNGNLAASLHFGQYFFVSGFRCGLLYSIHCAAVATKKRELLLLW
jgi:hypothetical protein